MKLDNKGFVVSTLMYSLLVVFLFLIVGLMTLLSDRKMILDKLKNDVKSDLNGMAKFDYYPDGTAIYFNPITNQKCNDYVEANSLNENKEGCLKWYTFNDNINKNKVSMILDHNTTDSVVWNSDGTNDEAKEADEDLRNLVNMHFWQVTPRFITADEIGRIIKNDNLTPATIYLDGTQKSGKGTSNYKWLYNYTNGCESYGCNIEYNSTDGYWLSTKYETLDMRIIHYQGNIDHKVVTNNNYGIRPVITLDKKVIK